LTTETGELITAELKHQPKTAVRSFYEQFSGQVIVGLKASGYSPWFEQLLEELGHQVWLGDATEIRRRAGWRQKNDRRDAELILDLMLHDEFPRLHRPSLQSREVMRTPVPIRWLSGKLFPISKNTLLRVFAVEWNAGNTFALYHTSRQARSVMTIGCGTH
jgi:hypothetical protein